MFDHNKLDEYKNAMEILGKKSVKLESNEGELYLSFYDMGEGYMYYCDLIGVTIAKSEDWGKFKNKVAKYFLGGEEK